MMREEYRLTVFENRMLRRIYGHNGQEVTILVGHKIKEGEVGGTCSTHVKSIQIFGHNTSSAETTCEN
jgi:hypothetical protein